jgi:hypothetical protein
MAPRGVPRGFRNTAGFGFGNGGSEGYPKRRFTGAGGAGSDYMGWHIDDVVVTVN